MIEFHIKGMEAIKKASEQSKKGLICTPYYSERGLQLLDPFFEKAEKVEFWTRFSPLDWKAGVADMAALNRRVQSVLKKGKEFGILVSDNLHAKIYSFNGSRIIIGSANLTWPAMTNNIEVVCELTGNEADTFSSVLKAIEARLIPVGADILAAYVDVSADAISKASDYPVEEDEEMNAAIDLAEETLRESLAPRAPDAPQIARFEIGVFIDYCRQEKTNASRDVIAKYEGLHNLQGHVKHCYYGAVRFLLQFPEFVSRIAATPGDALYDFTDVSVRTKWRDFLLEHANEIDKGQKFGFRTLRVYLPENLGGTCTGGGGGSGTLKRVLPLVTRMMQTSGMTNAQD